MKKENRILITEVIIAIFLVICLTSCGSRKVNKSETKETETKTETKTEQTETKVTDNTKIIDTSTTDEFEIIPIDNSLPIIYNGVKVFNGSIKHKKSKNNISIAKDVKVQHKAQKRGLKTVKTNKVVQQKQIERKQSYYSLLWLLILIPIYFVYKKYKDYI
jgi:hypothetical protein